MLACQSNKLKKIFCTVMWLVLLFTICGCSGRKTTINYTRSAGEVLKEYAKGEDYYMIMKEGDQIIKYRIYVLSSIGQKSVTFKKDIYSVDPTTQICLSGGAEVDCSKVKKDPDLAPYITW